MKLFLVTIALVMSFSVLAAGKGNGACKTDRETLCSTITPGNWAIHDCLYSNLSSISDATCKTNVENMNKLKTDCASVSACSSATGPKMFIKCLSSESKAGTLTDETCKSTYDSLKPTQATVIQ